MVTYLAKWNGIQTNSALTGGNDMAIFNVAFVPEPASASLLVLGVIAIHSIRRRRA